MTSTTSTTTSDYRPGERCLVAVPGTKIELHGTIVDPAMPEGYEPCPDDHVRVRFDGQACAYAPTPIAYLRGTWAAAE